MQKIITLDFFPPSQNISEVIADFRGDKLSCHKRSINKGNYREKNMNRISLHWQTIGYHIRLWKAGV